MRSAGNTDLQKQTGNWISGNESSVSPSSGGCRSRQEIGLPLLVVFDDVAVPRAGSLLFWPRALWRVCSFPDRVADLEACDLEPAVLGALARLVDPQQRLRAGPWSGLKHPSPHCHLQPLRFLHPRF
eukprot:scaffold379109_cov42-Prasinocladus_malaysianus.AAC.2